MTISQQNPPAPENIHFQTLADAGPDSNPEEVVQAFKEVISFLYEKDYGDFMREVNLYLDYLERAFGSGPPEALERIRQMRDYAVFTTADAVEEEMRARLLRDADRLLIDRREH